ncbi:MAG: hypothetical protein IPM47_06790 [Sphingobacteriales bacterium]|nr:MAG: hypothetical protein IPM47_06790 [Sphingobacteriales bacterium]
MKSLLLSSLVLILFCVLLTISSAATGFAQNTDRKTTDSPLSKTVLQKMDSVKTAAKHKLQHLQNELKGMDVEVEEGNLVVDGKSIDFVSPMSDVISGIEQCAKALGWKEGSLDPLREQVKEVPQMMKDGLDFLRDSDWGLETPPQDNTKPNHTSKLK